MGDLGVSYSVVVPVYGNEQSLPLLGARLGNLARQLDGSLEVVFVVDGSPDRSSELLAELLPAQPFASRLVLHSRNFGSFAAIRTGLQRATGRYVGVMAADLQEPPELMLDFFAELRQGTVDLVVGKRRSRTGDPFLTALSSRAFWAVYRRFVQPQMPAGGVDVFACTAEFRERLVELDESHSSLVSLALWLGFRRATVEYDRQPREHGSSAWTLRRRLTYLGDSVFSFTDLPILLLLRVGVTGVVGSVALATAVVIAKLSGAINVPGYSATVVVIAFAAGVNLFGLGIVGAYVWRTFENTKRRPTSVVMAERSFRAEPIRRRALDDEPSIRATAVRGVRICRLPVARDLRGALVAAELRELVPFVTRRCFLVFDVPSTDVRGQHAHRLCHQFLVCVQGRLHVIADDSAQRQEVVLEDNRTGLYLPPLTWSTQYRYSRDATLLVLASHAYDADDYIRDYDAFLAEARATRRDA
jgi:polyisoprenyl-phosphate glycosyltransferase